MDQTGLHLDRRLADLGSRPGARPDAQAPQVGATTEIDFEALAVESPTAPLDTPADR